MIIYRPKATNKELAIEFDPQTGKVVDSAQFTGKTYNGVGHIQAYWSEGMDETYILDFVESLLSADGEWQLVQ